MSENLVFMLTDKVVDMVKDMSTTYQFTYQKICSDLQSKLKEMYGNTILPYVVSGLKSRIYFDDREEIRQELIKVLS